MNKKNKTQNDESRINDFLSQFAKENPSIRQSISSTLPAYNQLISCNALSFEEFALKSIAREKGMNVNDQLLDYSDIKPPCPYCQTDSSIIKKGKDGYFCTDCKKKFQANHNSISSQSKTSSLTWMQVLQCLLNHKTIKQTCEYCEISVSTYYAIRNNLFYGMKVLLDKLKLYGNVESDITYVRVNYKGMRLQDQDEDYDEDTLFYENNFIPRSARARGGSYSHDEVNSNHIAVFTAVDDRGHVMTTFTGVGITNTNRLLKTVDSNKFLTEVPRKDPFSLAKKTKKENLTKAGARSLFITDGEGALIHFAKKINLDVEHHVYRRNGIQVKLAHDAHNIQRVNNIHKKLKVFLGQHNYVSSKYLPGYLTLFDFLENTGASDQAINALFEILARPGLGVSPEYFNELFTIPNYIVEWGQEDNPLNKLPFSKLKAAYGYHCYLKDKEQGEPGFLLKELCNETSLDYAGVRRQYKNFKASGLLDDIISFFENESGKDPNESKKKFKKTVDQTHRFSPAVLCVYDEYANFRTRPKRERCSTKVFFESMNEKYGVSYGRTMWLYWCDEIEKSGLRPPLPEWNNRTNDTVAGFSVAEQMRMEKVLNIYEDVERSLRAKNQKLTLSEKLDIVAEKTNLAHATILTEVQRARRIRRVKASKNNNEE